MEDPIPDNTLSTLSSPDNYPHHHISSHSEQVSSKQQQQKPHTALQDNMSSTLTEYTDADGWTDIVSHSNDANLSVKQMAPSASASRQVATATVSAPTATAATSQVQSEPNGHGHHRRRKAQFEVGDEAVDTDKKEVNQQVRDIRHQATADPETTGEETEGDDEPAQTTRYYRQQSHPTSRSSKEHDNQHYQVPTSSSTAASAAVPVAVASNADPRDENGVRVATASSREDESLAKTLIDSSLARTIQDLSLQTVEQNATNISEELREQEQQPQREEQARVRERNHSEQNQDETHRAGQNRNIQQQELSVDGQTKDRQSISQPNQTSDRRGHALEKSKSNPPEKVSTSGEGSQSHATHKSSASIHESQNLSESPKPRHRALSKTSPTSKRLSMLLDPSFSTATLPSLTKVTTHTVMAIPPKQGAVVGDTSPTTISSESSRAHGNQSGKLSGSSPTLQPSPAVELVSKFLTSGTTATTSISHASNDDDHHPQTGSPGHIRRSPKSVHDKSNATSPQQRTGYTSKFYPVSPSQPQLSSSAPKSTTTSKNLIPPTIVTTSTSDENLPDMASAAPTPASATGPTTGPFSAGLNSAATASAIAAAAVAQSNMAGGGSRAGTLSRTQQKLWLQRENLQDVDEDEMARRGRMQKEMDRIQREYKCVRMTLDPSMESLLRCLARSGKSPLQLQQQAAAAAAAAKASTSQPQSPHLSSQGHSPILDQQQHRSLQHHRSLQQLNGHQGQQQMQQLQQQGHVGLGLQNGPGGVAGANRDSGKMTLRQVHQLQQLHHQQQQQQQGHHHAQQQQYHQQQQQQNYRQQHHG
ncbi:hypothetical protein FBU30_006347 [Linnemannia zychae]|nr:hypothetical protein FBU30_006347 [Linnemannia zychae]